MLLCYRMEIGRGNVSTHVESPDPQALDCDVILAAQALAMDATVVTDNVGHLALFVEAKSWRDVPVAEDTL